MDLSNSNQIADSILAALSGKHYLLAVAVALVGVVKGVRWLAPKLHDKTGAFLNSDRGGAILSLIMGVAGGAATSLAAGKPLSLSLILSGIMVSATGSGLFNLTKRVVKPNDKPAAPPTAPPAAALLPLLLIPTLLLSSCAFCKDAIHSAEPRCVLEQNMLKCGEQGGLGLLPIIGTLIVEAVSGVPIDVNSLISQLESAGVKDIPCVLAALEDYIGGNAKLYPPKLQNGVHRVLVAALAKKGVSGKTTIKLKNGHAVEAVVQ